MAHTMTAPAQLGRLVERFASHRQAYRSVQYNEAQLREEFLNPFFEALGWDVYNRKGYAEPYKEVIHEAAIKVAGRTKAPDYCFRAGGGVRSFFVEAKKPSIDIRQAISPAYQLRRYAWSAKLPVSILTDFEEFAVYDCRIRPVKTDKPSTARVIYRKYTEYIDRWDELFGLFSPESIRRGSLEKFVASKRVKKGTAEVDAAFLGEIESWRDVLARNIALRNKGISQRDLNFAVQRTIDRTIFLRICEDRGIEPYGTLQALTNGPNIYRKLAELFQRADQRYNSGLFYFTVEKDRTDPPDELTLGLSIDDKPLKEIIRSIYFPDSPYEFSVLPAEILGQVYEQFLGKVIRLTRGGQAKVEEKPEVRKAGGVYYTPAYIVNYIVEQTVGKILEGGAPKPEGGAVHCPVGSAPKPEGGAVHCPVGSAPKPAHAPKPKTPKQVGKLKILDPACGSGSFLIGAYQYLLDWHRDRYVESDPEKHARGRNPRLYRGPAGQWRLTTAEKKRILLNNIYGVDIDPQAVEVTKLSLLLKVLEGESQQTISNQLRLFHERALPDLSANIKCGNSLIGPDFYTDRQKTLLDEEEIYRINAFNWQTEFPQIFKRTPPGFDAVIGNPPWVSLSGKFGADVFSRVEVDYLIRRFEGNTYMPNMYEYFVTQGLVLTRDAGRFSFIVPDRLGFNSQFISLRRRILTTARINSLVYRVPFPGITADTLMFVFQKGKAEEDHIVDISEYGRPGIVRHQTEILKHPAHAFEYFENVQVMQLIGKIDSSSKIICIGNLCDSTSGFGGKSNLIEQTQSSTKQIPTLKGDSIIRYEIRKGYWFDFRRENITGRTTDTKKLGASPKILLRKTGDQIIATYDDSGIFPEQSLYFLYNNRTRMDFRFVLGVLNSRLLSFYYRCKSLTNRKSIAQVKKVDLDCLPIARLDLSAPADKLVHDRMVELVERMLSLHKQLSSAGTAHQKTVIQRQIDTTDHQIDRLVYELYGLSEEEIAIVEG